MSKKISELEDVLAGLHTGDEPHPLLTDEHMLVKALPSTEKANDASNRPLAALLGTLAIGPEPRFYGPNAASDYLLHVNEPAFSASWNVADPSACTLPIDLLALSRTFPLANLADLREEVWPRLGPILPAEPLARELLDSFYAYAGWLFEVVTREELDSSIVHKIYATGAANLDDVSPHDLGLLSMLLCFGAMVDVRSRPIYCTQAADYYQLARVALSLDSVLDHPSVQAVRAVHLMCWFLHMTDHPAGVTIAYNLLGLNAQLCHSVRTITIPSPRLTRCSSVSTGTTRPGISTCRKRRGGGPSCGTSSRSTAGSPRRSAVRQVSPCCTSMHACRRKRNPSSRISRTVRCAALSKLQLTRPVRQWIHSFTSSCVLKVLDQAFGVARLTHATVLRLDRLVRENAQVKGDALRVVNVGKPEELFLANPSLPADAQPQEDETARVQRAMQRTTVFVLTQKCTSLVIVAICV